MEEIRAETRVVVDGDLSAAKLTKLIQLGAEEERLDYKLGYNLATHKATKDKVEVSRDIMALANTYGGYIVLGIREGGEDEPKYIPEGLSADLLDSLDIDTLRAQVEKYVAERLDIQLQVHSLPEFSNRQFALIYVPPSDHSPIIAQSSGNYPDPSTGETKSLFQAGDILVRKGASSIRADQTDMRRLISRTRQREKDAWTEEILGMRELVQRLDTLISVLSSGSVSPTSLAKAKTGYDENMLILSPAVFQSHILELLEEQKEVSVRRYLQEIPKKLQEAIGKPADSDDNAILESLDNHILPLLDNLTMVGIATAQYQLWGLFEEVQHAFYGISKDAARAPFAKPSDQAIHFGKTRIWREVIARVYALGGLLVKLGHFDHTPTLIRQEIDWDRYERGMFWSRYILTELSRANRLEEKSLVRLGVKYIEEHAWFSKAFMDDLDQIVAAVCQFDFLQCVHATVDTRSVYPSFGIYNNHRTEPIVAKLIILGKVRQSIPELSDAALAEIIRGLDKLAGREYWHYNGWEPGWWSDERIRQFLAAHQPTDETTA